MKKATNEMVARFLNEVVYVDMIDEMGEFNPSQDHSEVLNEAFEQSSELVEEFNDFLEKESEVSKTMTLKSFLDVLEAVRPGSVEVEKLYIRLYDTEDNFIDFTIHQVDNDGYDTEASMEELVNQDIDSLIFNNIYGTKPYLYPSTKELGEFIGELYEAVR